MNEQDKDGLDADGAQDSGNGPASPIAPLLPRHIHRGWWIVLAGAVAWATANFADSLSSSGFFGRPSGFDTPLALGLVVIASLLLLLPGRPLVGLLVDHGLERAVIVAALVLSGLSIGITSVVSDAPWQLFAIAIIVGSLAVVVLHISLATTAAKWFHRNLGMAFAVLLLGSPLASLMPLLAFETPILGRFMLRAIEIGEEYGAYLSAGALVVMATLILGAVLMVYLLRANPLHGVFLANELGLADGKAREAENLQGRGNILRNRSYILYISALSLQVMGITTLLVAASGYALDVGTLMPNVLVVVDIPVLFPLLGIGGLLLTGWLSDRYDRKRVVMWILAGQILGVLLTVFAASVLGSVPAAIVVGAGSGAASAANLALQTELWGRRHFGLLMGLQMSIASIFAIIWTPVSLFFIVDQDSDFATIPLAAIPLAIALVLILLMKRPKSRSSEADSEPQVAA